MRIGHGFDVHRFSDKHPLIIGGVNIPYSKGLVSYSDGDVVLHAIIDALLGASACGDIGTVFPDTDPTYKNANSRKLLSRTWQKIEDQGYHIGNLDVTIIVQAPKMALYIPQMRIHIANSLSCNIDLINVKATSTEYLGFTGRGEGIACTAIVLLT
ncbi:2-C-methyl-D-erythritol 2,4-cyclodiphosphate synthase [Candidatus Curculioniphilus buchneri]|uniref:2-C-methyl-D-erythritol 2,4-cyclodiphosphate synthase n=1 Tax=Candidatus Curculioniphilus buchneri TaxID=690594 RepID=UPI00376EBC57